MGTDFVAKNHKSRILSSASECTSDADAIWINPIGGLGDILMLSGVLKLALDENPSRQFNLVRRSPYLNLLRGHPAIKKVGFPPSDARVIGSDYWAKEPLGEGSQRAFQVLARALGLSTPVEENLYLPEGPDGDALLHKMIPWRSKNAIIAPASDSPRKMMHPMQWHELVEQLIREDILVIQVGKPGEVHIKNAYSLLGVTTPRQLIALIRKCDLVITSDNFIMHAAHLTKTPAIVVWGPTESKVYGYPEHVHLVASLSHCNLRNECIGPQHPNNYGIPCPLNADHCMARISVHTLFDKVMESLPTGYY